MILIYCCFVDYIRPLYDLSAFENEWMEIELLGCSNLWNDEPTLPHIPNFLKDIPPPQSWTDCCKNSKKYKIILGNKNYLI